MTLDAILQLFPAQVHALTLVHDLDRILADETILARLTERGFSIFNEIDSSELRHEVNESGAWSVQRPLIIINLPPFTQLPYDYWRQGRCVALALHAFFPTLAYPARQSLSPNQRWRLLNSRRRCKSWGGRATWISFYAIFLAWRLLCRLWLLLVGLWGEDSRLLIFTEWERPFPIFVRGEESTDECLLETAVLPLTLPYPLCRSRRD